MLRRSALRAIRRVGYTPRACRLAKAVTPLKQLRMLSSKPPPPLVDPSEVFATKCALFVAGGVFTILCMCRPPKSEEIDMDWTYGTQVLGDYWIVKAQRKDWWSLEELAAHDAERDKAERETRKEDTIAQRKRDIEFGIVRTPLFCDRE